MAKQTKVKMVGSAYFNVKKDTDKATLKKLRNALEFLKDNQVYLSLSMKNEEGEYDRFFCGFNSYKEDQAFTKSKDCDLYVRDSDMEVSSKGKKTKKKAKPVEYDEDETDEDMPWD